ncbi:MAG: type II toxin-antitoxin system YafQ family toxin [Defluviitaleaceae bacterium]|nr:type II toxin-antitoxin system YafQ family toxin [Defluviitaleaceae bacterium]
MYTVKPTTRFQKDLKRVEKRGYDLSLLTEVLAILKKGEQLPEKYKDHALKGDYIDCRECHITPDWLLVYRKKDDTLYLYLTRTGTHSDLF